MKVRKQSSYVQYQVHLLNCLDRVTMYCFEEIIEGKKLTEIINTTHENIKYLPNHKLPENVASICYLLISTVTGSWV